jgi:hypothetical protein
VSNDATLASVAGLAVPADASNSGNSPGNAKKASLEVHVRTSMISLADIKASHPAAVVELFMDEGYSLPGLIDLASGVPRHLFIKVTAEDGQTVLFYDITVTRAAADSSGPDTGAGPSTSTPPTADGSLAAWALMAASLAVGLLCCLAAMIEAKRLSRPYFSTSRKSDNICYVK